jgi:hypothetical protein
MIKCIIREIISWFFKQEGVMPIKDLHFKSLSREAARREKRAGLDLNISQIEGAMKLYEDVLLEQDPFDIMCYLRNRLVYKKRLKQLKVARDKKNE